jgi:hypothetical protein
MDQVVGVVVLVRVVVMDEETEELIFLAELNFVVELPAVQAAVLLERQHHWHAD